MIWIIGSNGMLAKEIPFFFENKFDYFGTGKEIDITDRKTLLKFAKEKNVQTPIKWIVNCAAYTNVEKAEEEKDIAEAVNTVGAENIAFAAKELNAKLIHISTDYVFDGKSGKPYLENDSPNPTGIYGLTKLNGEKKIQNSCDKFFIIRTAWLYGKGGKNFVSTMLNLMREKKSLTVVNDQFGSPTWTFDLAETIFNFIHSSENCKDIPYGIYNFTNEGIATWYDFAKKIYETAGKLNILNKNCFINTAAAEVRTIECKILPCSSKEFPSKVRRPPYSVLDKSKIKKELCISIPMWSESLEEFLKCAN